MLADTQLQCRPELLRQWRADIEKDPRAFALMLAGYPQLLLALVHDAAAAATVSTSLEARPVVVNAFQIADEAMFERLDTEGVAEDEFHTVIGFTREGGEEVKSLAEASDDMQEAFNWLRDRGYVELGSDAEGEFAQVITRPADDGYTGLPLEALESHARRECCGNCGGHGR